MSVAAKNPRFQSEYISFLLIKTVWKRVKFTFSPSPSLLSSRAPWPKHLRSMYRYAAAPATAHPPPRGFRDS